MGKAVLKWLAAVGTGVAAAIIAAISAHTGTLDLGDPVYTGFAAGLLAKLVTWLTSLLPAQPTPPADSAARRYTP